jgi:hypothetical protein
MWSDGLNSRIGTVGVDNVEESVWNIKALPFQDSQTPHSLDHSQDALKLLVAQVIIDTKGSYVLQKACSWMRKSFQELPMRSSSEVQLNVLVQNWEGSEIDLSRYQTETEKIFGVVDLFQYCVQQLARECVE